MNTYETLVELTKSLVLCPKNKQREFIEDLITKIYNREIRDEKVSRIKELEDRVSALSIRNGLSD